MPMNFSSSFSDITGSIANIFGLNDSSTTVNGNTSGTIKKTVNDSGQVIGGISVEGQKDTSGSSTTGTTGTSSTVNSGSVDSTANSGSKNVTTSSGTTSATTNRGGTTVVESDRTNVTKNSGRTDYTQVDLSNEAVARVMDNAFSAVGGLADTAKGKNIAGGYNDTVNMQLVNDLLTRVSGEVAMLGAKHFNVTGDSTSTTVLGGGTTSTSTYGESNTDNSGAQVIQDIGASTSTTNRGGSTSTATNNSNSTTNMNQTTGPVTSVQQQVAGPRVMSEEQITDMKTEQKQEQEDEGWWIVCTELFKQGRMSRTIYSFGSTRFAEYDAQIKKGYYYWAVAAVDHLRKYPTSNRSNFLEWLFNHRATYITAQRARYSPPKKTFAGWFALVSVHAFCWILSRTLARNYIFNPSDVYPDYNDQRGYHAT